MYVLCICTCIWESCWLGNSCGAKLQNVKFLIGHWPFSCRQEVFLVHLQIGHTNHAWLSQDEEEPPHPVHSMICVILQLPIYLWAAAIPSQLFDIILLRYSHHFIPESPCLCLILLIFVVTKCLHFSELNTFYRI